MRRLVEAQIGIFKVYSADKSNFQFCPKRCCVAPTSQLCSIDEMGIILLRLCYTSC